MPSWAPAHATVPGVTRWIALVVLALAAPGCFRRPALPPDDPVVIALARTECLAGCPAYEVRITRSGIVDYEGHSLVAHEGWDRWIIPKAHVDALLHRFERRRFRSVPEDVLGGDTCQPVIELSFRDHNVRYTREWSGSSDERQRYASAIETLAAEVDRAVDIESRIGTTNEHWDTFAR